MNQRTFAIQLVVISVLMIPILLGIHSAPRFQEYSLLSWVGIAFFVLISILMYFLGSKAAMSENKNTFTNVVIGFTMGKMMLSVIIILIYNKLVAPDDKLFILPFFGIYLVYTIFETYFMMKLGRMKS